MKTAKLLFFFLTVFSINAQDTLFHRSLHLDKYVSNVSTDGNELYLRIGDSIYSYSNDKIRYIAKGSLRFSFIKQNDYGDNYYWSHDEYITKQYNVKHEEVRNILPGLPNGFITKARIKNNLFVCYNGTILEYRINELPKLFYRGKSIRNVYSDGHLRVISTYSGVFSEKIVKNENFKFNGTKILPYSHGEFTKIGSHYYLCRDLNLYRYNEEKNKLEEYQNFQDLGEIRQLIEFGNNVFIVSLEGLALLDLKKKKASEPLVKGKITRAKKIGSELIVVTKTGTIYKVSEQFEIDKIQTNFSFEDVEIVNEEIYIGGKSGLFKLLGNEVIKINSSREIFELHNFKGFLIFSNFNGLYAWINSSAIPIVNNVEFNRYGLSNDNHIFYAGSINGLYIIGAKPFEVWLKNKKEIQVFNSHKKAKINNYIIYGILILIIISLIIIIIRNNNKIKEKSTLWTESEFSIVFLEKIIKEYNIISVEELANQLNISKVQLNRKLAKKGTSGLKVLKNCKRKIAKELFTKGVPIKNISKQLGYSIRYIKENFLN